MRPVLELAWAAEAGLDLVGVAPVGPTPSWAAYQTWLAQGYAGTMTYLARPDAVERRADPRRVLPEARSLVVVAASYAGAPHLPLPPLVGRVSRYAWGEDYHHWLRARLEALMGRLAAATGPFPYRCYVDTGPLLERAWAQAAGLGWVGKNACLLHPQLGSYLFLGVALIGLELEPASPPSWPTCGRCTRCLEACPTGALVAPGVVDARRCLAYLTVEHRGPIPEPWREAVGEWLFGCDLCQEVCPWNRRALAAHATETPPPGARLALPELLALDEAGFRARFRHTPLWRATRAGLARNAALVLGNRGDPTAAPALQQAATADPDPVVREQARWSLARLGFGAGLL